MASSKNNKDYKEEFLNTASETILLMMKELSNDTARYINDIIKDKFNSAAEAKEQKKERIKLLEEKKDYLLMQADKVNEEKLLEEIAFSERMFNFITEKQKIEDSKTTKFNIYFKNHHVRSFKLLKESFDWQYLNQRQRVLLKRYFITEYRNIQKNNKHKSHFLRNEHSQKVKNLFFSTNEKIVESFLNREEYNLAFQEYNKNLFFERIILRKKEKDVNLQAPNPETYFNENNDYICKLEIELKNSQDDVVHKGNALIDSINEAIDNVGTLSKEEKEELLDSIKIIEEIEEPGESYDLNELQERAYLLKNLIMASKSMTASVENPE